MSKKTQAIIWVTVSVVVLVCIVLVVYGIVMHNFQNVKHPEVSFEIEGYGTVKMELYPEYAPNTVVNFIRLAEKGYYNGKVVYGKDSLAEYWGRNQEGSVDSVKLSTIDDNVEETSDKNYEYEINGEFIANKFNQNTLPHERGIVSMVRADYTQQIPTLINESYNSATSQFTIIVGENAKALNGLYAAFGRVTEGMDIVDKMYDLAIQTEQSNETDNILSTDTTSASIQKFEVFPVITSTTVETYGVDYGMPTIKEAFNYSNYLYQLMSRYYSNSAE